MGLRGRWPEQSLETRDLTPAFLLLRLLDKVTSAGSCRRALGAIYLQPSHGLILIRFHKPLEQAIYSVSQPTCPSASLEIFLNLGFRRPGAASTVIISNCQNECPPAGLQHQRGILPHSGGKAKVSVCICRAILPQKVLGRHPSCPHYLLLAPSEPWLWLPSWHLSLPIRVLLPLVSPLSKSDSTDRSTSTVPTFLPVACFHPEKGLFLIGDL